MSLFPGPEAEEPHEFQYDGRYGCAVCGSKMHCSRCSKGCGPQGHLVSDDEGTYIHCEDPERWERQRQKFLKRR